MQTYLPFNPKLLENRCTHCLAFSHASAIFNTNWMTSNKLMLNSVKTELLVFNARHRTLPPLESITIGLDVIHASHAAKNIRVWFDEFLSMDKQVKAVCKWAFFHLCNIAKISIQLFRERLSGKSAKVNATIP